MTDESTPVPGWLSPELSPSGCTTGNKHCAEALQRIGRLVVKILGDRDAYLHVARCEVEGEPDFVFATIAREKRASYHCSRATLLEVLEAAADEEPTRICMGPCRRVLTPGHFTRKSGKDKSISPICKKCERERQMDQYRAKRERLAK